MAKAVFMSRVSPSYKDMVEAHYHFPGSYLSRVEQTVGDQIVYYEPSRTGEVSGPRSGRMAYFATAVVTEIIEDDTAPDHYFAKVTGYSEFDRDVPLRHEGLPDAGSGAGKLRSAVRILEDLEFDTILAVGFNRALFETREPPTLDGLQEPEFEYERPIRQRVTNQPVRDSAFRFKVRDAYDFTCAITGLRIINGGGRPEMEAAHIKPVGDDHKGPDSVRNGIALCRTAHWMFERGIISLNDDFSLLTSEKQMPENARQLFHLDRMAKVPDMPQYQPHPKFLEYHRDVIFKG